MRRRGVLCPKRALIHSPSQKISPQECPLNYNRKRNHVNAFLCRRNQFCRGGYICKHQEKCVCSGEFHPHQVLE